MKNRIKRLLYFSKIGRKLGLVKTTVWGIGLRKACDKETLFGDKDRKIVFNSIPNTEDYWYADPLLFSDNGKTWLFVEAFNRKERKGEIGVFDIVDGSAKNFRLLITMPTHMSYPFVFKHEGEYFMIPESGAAGCINLYKATSFPDKWSLEKVLLTDDCYRDSTIYKSDGQLFMLSYKQNGTNSYNMKNYLTLFHLNMKKKELSIIDQFFDKDRINRPAGPCFETAGDYYRVSQNCRRLYGESMYVYKMDPGKLTIDKSLIMGQLKSRNISIDGHRDILVTHTYSSAGEYEVVDYRCLV